MKSPTNAERQQRYRENVKAKGLVEIKLIIPKAMREELNQIAKNKHLTVSELIIHAFGY